MKMNPRPLSALAALALAAAPGLADTVMTVFTGDEAQNVEMFQLGDVGKVTFSDGVLAVFGEADALAKIDLSTVSRISFSSAETGVKSVAGTSGARLLRNPVADLISVVGATPGSTVRVHDMWGRQMLGIDGWNGEDIDVSSLPSGTYLLRINSETIKVIKK